MSVKMSLTGKDAPYRAVSKEDAVHHLGERLGKIAAQIAPGDRVADVGTDHGKLPFYLFQNGTVSSLILTDISRPSLNKAEALFSTVHAGKSVFFRVGNGLDPLREGEANVLILAGMGGLLMHEILDWDISKTFSFEKIILQPRGNAGLLRHFLLTSGFTVTQDVIAREGGRFAEIVSACPDGRAMCETAHREETELTEEEKACYDFPNAWTDAPEENVKPYIETLLRTEAKIKSAMEEGLVHAGKRPQQNAAWRRTRVRMERLVRLFSSLKEGKAGDN